MRVFACVLLCVFAGLCGETVLAQGISNEGTDFYAVFPTHVESQGRLANYRVFITGKQNSQVVVSVGSFSRQIPITANAVNFVDIPRSSAYINASEQGAVLSNRAIHITVLPGQPKVVVYGHIFAGARSAASLILPKEAMGQQYFSMNYTNQPNGGGDNFIVVAATEDNTKVFLKRNGTVLATIDLAKAGDVYEYMSTADLTGVEIIADPVTSGCKRFAVFSGNSNVLITGSCTTSNAQGSDPLYQQNYPVESWGTTYGFVPFSTQTPSGASTRSLGSFFRVLAKEDGTVVKVNGATVATLSSGQFYQPSAPSAVASIITASNPVAVAQYALSQTCQGGGTYGDPDMVILNPVEYNIKNITVFSSTAENITEQYLNIVIKTSAAASFKVNGGGVAGFRPLQNTVYSYLQLSLNRYNSTDYVLSADDGFNAIAYGFGDKESYAYSAGTNLASNQYITAVHNNRKDELTTACTKEDFEFKLVLPEIATRLTWKFETDPALVQNNPPFTTSTRNGKTVYEYYYPRPQIFQTPGQRSINVLALYSSSNTCFTTEQEINLVFDVYDPPEAKFSGPPDACPLSPVVFTDQSKPNGKPIIKWAWDFGDGTFSSDQNPTHTYTSSGTFTAMLSVDNGTGCSSNVYAQQIVLRPQPIANFTAPIGNCDDFSMLFSNNANGADSPLVKWIWDFGDSTIVERSTGDPLMHTFPGFGNYNVKLTVLNSNGCESNAFTATVKVFAPMLEAGPDRTILRGGQTPLKITAVGTNLTYKWSPSAGLDFDNVKTPVASPSQDTRYTVTITTEEGCTLTDIVNVKVVDSFVVPNTFTPNSDGINDVWNILYLDTFPDAVLTIYNRYGVQLFASVGYAVPWDGRAKGEELPVGTYYYLIKPGHGFRLFSGSITIIR